MATKKRKQTKKAAKPVGVKAKSAAPGGGAAATIQCWTTDPIGGSPPIQLAAPQLPGSPLPVRIVDPAQAPKPQVYATGTAEFRYWTAAEALRRAADLWSSAGTTAWNPALAGTLPVRLDDGVDLNAYYARDDAPSHGIRQGLTFFHDTVRETATGRDVTVFSGESPDIVAHELGHAVLDAIKPELWGLALTEAAAFHEGCGDVSALLAALELPQVRQEVLQETGGRLARNSFLSRVAEQLGFAIRQMHPDAVDVDSLRNAANSFAYVDPLTLPANGPATALTRSAHNFSRVFSGACLEALAGMARSLGDPPTGDDVHRASRDLAALLVRAVVNAPVRTRFFQSVAEQLVLADAALFAGKYAEPLSGALVRRGLLPLASLGAMSAAKATSPRRAVAAAALTAATAAGGVDAAGTVEQGAEPVRIALDGGALGLSVSNLYVEVPAIDDATPPGFLGVVGVTGASGREAAARSFVEELIVRGRVAGDSPRARIASLTESTRRRRVTHRLVESDSGLRLERLAVDCAWHCGCCGRAVDEGAYHRSSRP